MTTIHDMLDLDYGVDGDVPEDGAIVNLTPVDASGFGNGLLISSDVKTDPPKAANADKPRAESAASNSEGTG